MHLLRALLHRLHLIVVKVGVCRVFHTIVEHLSLRVGVLHVLHGSAYLSVTTSAATTSIYQAPFVLISIDARVARILAHNLFLLTEVTRSTEHATFAVREVRLPGRAIVGAYARGARLGVRVCSGLIRHHKIVILFLTFFKFFHCFDCLLVKIAFMDLTESSVCGLIHEEVLRLNENEVAQEWHEEESDAHCYY